LLSSTTVLPTVIGRLGLALLYSVKVSCSEVPSPPGLGYTMLLALSAARNEPGQVAMLVAMLWEKAAGRTGPGGGGAGGSAARHSVSARQSDV
jgi:hypothetical protein